MDWATIAQLATAVATLVLAIATFATVRSSNRTARAAEQSLNVGLRPLLLASRIDDPPEKIGFMDEHWARVQGGHGHAHVGDGVIHLAMPLRNVGQGIAVLHGWRVYLERLAEADHAHPDDFRRLGRDLFVPPGDRGFWQGALRDPTEDLHGQVERRIKAREAFSIELLYGDNEGGQRAITRFLFSPIGDEDDWLASAGRQWNVDRGQVR